MVAASYSSSDDDMSLGAEYEEAPAATHDVASPSTVPQCRGVCLHQDQFTSKYEAHWKDNLSM
jgi:hypothetical protein